MTEEAFFSIAKTEVPLFFRSKFFNAFLRGNKPPSNGFIDNYILPKKPTITQAFLFFGQ